MRPFFRRALLFGALALALSPRPGHGQGTPCAYDQCALRLRRGSLVQGLRGARVVGLVRWFSAPRIDLFETAADSARQHYLAYRRLYDNGGKWNAAGLVLIAASITVLFTNPNNNTNRTVGFGLVFASIFPVSFIESQRKAAAWDHLGQAIWFYNRDLPHSP